VIPDPIAVMVHESTDLVRKLDYAQTPIRLHVESDVELRVRLRSVQKEPEMLPWLRDSIRPGEVFYDIGANVGAYSLLACAAHGGAIDVVSFEPSATNYAQLCRNLALNAWAGRITPIPVALSDKRGFVGFGYSSLTAGSALHSFRSAAGSTEDSYVQQVMTARLDDLVAEYDLPKPNAIKIDVDGAEVAVISGAQATLREAGLRSVLIELEEDTHEFTEVSAHLAAAGFRVVGKHHLFARFHNFRFERA
jgi:FkbM family methyltransferase